MDGEEGGRENKYIQPPSIKRINGHNLIERAKEELKQKAHEREVTDPVNAVQIARKQLSADCRFLEGIMKVGMKGGGAKIRIIWKVFKKQLVPNSLSAL